MTRDLKHGQNSSLKLIYLLGAGSGGGAGAQQEGGLPDPGEGEHQAPDGRDPHERTLLPLTHRLHRHRPHEGVQYGG